jgi:SAM-dependent methyltransferase
VRQQGLNLFLVGFLILFLELACIRWFSAYVIFLQFFTNVVLIACFLGMSCGCMAARRRPNWLAYFPLIALGTVAAAVFTFSVYHFWSGIAVDVGQQASPQEVFFGTEYRNPDAAQFVIPIEAIAGVFFILVALMFVGLGQVLGRAFDAYPDRVVGYTLNISGSVLGILSFSVLSFLEAPPVVWFLPCLAGVAYLLHQSKSLTPPRILALLAVVVIFAARTEWQFPQGETRWSPYYSVYREKETGQINVNTISHQTMVPFEKSGSPYSMIHLLQRHSGGAPFQDVLVIGAGSGNDLAHALRFGVGRIDAVEIDPVIQDIGRRYHPDRPYQDSRVVPHLDDGRHFLRTTDRKYDLVVYAVVDSLILHSGYANIRLESYLFTKQAFSDVARVLKPGGLFVMYNYLREGWIVERIAGMARQIFGCDPMILSLPYRETLKSSERAGLTMIIAGCSPRIDGAFRQNSSFWMNVAPPVNLNVDGFAVHPEGMAPAERAAWQLIAPTRLIHDQAAGSEETSDDWPFLYISGKLIPGLTIRSVIMMGVLGLAMVWLFLPKGRLQFDSRMFFLGAGFMLLETKAVVQMALLFGSTWVVNSAVFLTVLILILLGNLYLLKIPTTRISFHYAGLVFCLAVAVLVPLDEFLSGSLIWRYGVPCVLALGPMFFAGVIFSRTFRDAGNPDQAFGSNIAGAVVGGLSESFSTLLGFRYLLVVALFFYILSMWVLSLRGRVASVQP